MRWLILAATFSIIAAAGCGGNSTAVSVTISPTTADVFEGKTQQFSANVSGASASGIYWQVCLPNATASIQPTNCTAIPGIAATNPLTGYGTITQTGLYTAPSSVPAQNNSVVMATSVVGSDAKGVAKTSTAFGLATITVDSGVRVQIFPKSPTIGIGNTLQFTASVSGSTNTAVSWTVKESLNGVDPGSITAGGLYTAPSQSPSGSVTVVATSAADPTQSASTGVTVTAATDTSITITSLHPSTAGEYSAQQDVYVVGTNFTSTDTVVVAQPPVGGQPPNYLPAPTTFISDLLLRATIPASPLALAGNLLINVSSQKGDLSTTGPATLTVVPSRPAVLASTPRSVTQDASGIAVNLTGGHFGASTGIAFNGQTNGINSSFNDPRHLSAVIPAGSLTIPGLYPLVVTNGDAASASVPSMTAVNLAVQPGAGSIPTGSNTSVSVGVGPSAVAIDEADGIAVVVNSGGNSVSLINLDSATLIGGAIAVGNQPTGVAVDDLLSHPLALVVNSADQTVTAIDLTTMSKQSISVSIGPAATSPIPYSIGVNPLTHRAIVTYQSTNQAEILDVSTGTPVFVQLIGGSLTQYSTGVLPAVAIDPQLNWAVVTPGGSVQSTNLVDLGANGGRSPRVIGKISLPATTQGIAINPETHQALLTDPSAATGGTFTSYSLLDNAVNPISFKNPDGSVFNQLHFVGVAVNQLTNIGVAVDENTGTAAVVDLQGGTVLQTGIQAGNTPEAVAVDPGMNLAVVADQSSNTVTIISLGSIRSVGAGPSPQIVECSPSLTYASTMPATLTIVGAGFVPGSKVFLDGTSVTVNSVSADGREMVATTSAVPTPQNPNPANTLAVPRRYAVTVQNGGGVSNAAALTVAQSVIVGSGPIGVAVDRERDLAVVTNSVDDTVSLIALSPTTPIPPNGVQAGAIGTIGSPIQVGIAPQGVAILPRLGLAVVANYGSNNAYLVNFAATSGPTSTAVTLCAGCLGANGVAIDEDTALAVVTNSLNPTGGPAYFASVVSLPTTPSGAASEIANPSVGQSPTGVAVDPNLEVAGISASQDNVVDIQPFGASVASPSAPAGLSLPAGVAFDSLNQVFLVANSLANSVWIVDPLSARSTPVLTGINPTSVDYDFQTSALVTLNSESGTFSVLDYDCPPIFGTACSTPHVRAAIGLGATLPPSATPIGPNAIAVDSNLDIAVVVDEGNNRVLLIPLPY